MNDNNTNPAPLQVEDEQTLTAQLNEASAKGLPFPVGGALTSIKTLLERDPCSHAKTAIAMIDAILLHGCAAQPVTVQEPEAITEQQAHDMGAKGADPTEAERLLFEAWMRGHCWALSATWDGKSYRSDAEQGGNLDPRAMATRRLWAAWRDRAALAAAQPAAQLSPCYQLTKEGGAK